MFLERPHLRFDGVYASRNTYIRTGIQEWRIKNPVHVVCYYRYVRFLPDGTFFYRTSPEILSKVAPALRIATGQRMRAEVHKGSFRLKVSRGLASVAGNSRKQPYDHWPAHFSIPAPLLHGCATGCSHIILMLVVSVCLF